MFMQSDQSMKRKRMTRRVRLQLDQLEARVTLSTLHVNTTCSTPWPRT